MSRCESWMDGKGRCLGLAHHIGPHIWDEPRTAPTAPPQAEGAPSASLRRGYERIVEDVAKMDCMNHPRPNQCDGSSWGACTPCKARYVLANVTIQPAPSAPATADEARENAVRDDWAIDHVKRVRKVFGNRLSDEIFGTQLAFAYDAGRAAEKAAHALEVAQAVLKEAEWWIIHYGQEHSDWHIVLDHKILPPNAICNACERIAALRAAVDKAKGAA